MIVIAGTLQRINDVSNLPMETESDPYFEILADEYPQTDAREQALAVKELLDMLENSGYSW